METQQAKALVAMLLAAYPTATLEPASVEMYVTDLRTLDDAKVALDAVQTIIRSSPRFPPISELRETYLVKLERARSAVPQLSAATVPPTPEALAAIRALGEKLGSDEVVAFAERLEALSVP